MDNTPLRKYNTLLDQRKYFIKSGPNHNFDHHKGVFSLFVYPNIQRASFLTLVLAAVVGVFLVGCGADQPRGDKDAQFYADKSSAVFAPEPANTPASELDLDEEDVLMAQKNIGGWSILLSKVGRGGGDGMLRAEELLKVIRQDAGLSEAYIAKRSSGLMIVYGDYLDKSDSKAIRDIERIRKVKLNGVKVFEAAIIMPPTSESLRGTNPSHDLRTVKGRYGDRAIYTLQVGIYGRADYQVPSVQDLAEFRRAAEDAARVLRSQGNMAFYYHAPARSMVTVGVFGERDFDATTTPPMQSASLKAVRDKFPNNLLNGQGINETIRTESGKVTRLQSSQLVSIPEK